MSPPRGAAGRTGLMRDPGPPERRREAVSDEAVSDEAMSGEVTFRGRGLAVRAHARLVLLVCPLCSQRNGRRGAERGVCEWCAYEPSPEDAEPVAGADPVA